MSETVYSRAPDVVWRLGPDRVLVRRIGQQGEDAAAELMGGAALVWIALDEPATITELKGRISNAAHRQVENTAVSQLLERAWLESQS